MVPRTTLVPRLLSLRYWFHLPGGESQVLNAEREFTLEPWRTYFVVALLFPRHEWVDPDCSVTAFTGSSVVCWNLIGPTDRVPWQREKQNIKMLLLESELTRAGVNGADLVI